MSLSVWRVWIEIDIASRDVICIKSLSVWRVWIEITTKAPSKSEKKGHSLYGECGLKLFHSLELGPPPMSLSVWRVWIEIVANYR